MKDTMKDLLLKLDSLKQKKETIVKQRDNEKVKAEELKKKTGLDLLSGVNIDKAGADLLKNRSRIETLNSAINALASTIQETERDLQEEKTRQAKKEAEALGEKADDLLIEAVKAFVKLAREGKRLSEMKRRAQELNTGFSGEALKHIDAGRQIYEGTKSILFNLQSIGGSIPGIIKQLK